MLQKPQMYVPSRSVNYFAPLRAPE